MGGFFGVVSDDKSALIDCFFGTDYHSHLGTKSAGIATLNQDLVLQKKIHNIENAPFRTKFENIFEIIDGKSCIGCINDTDPQPLIVNSKLGRYAICFVGYIQNQEKLSKEYIDIYGGQFNVQNGGRINSTELLSSYINLKDTFEDGINFAWNKIEGTASILILKENGNLIVARDKMGRLPCQIGKKENSKCVSFEAFAHEKLGYKLEYELGPAEIIEISSKDFKILSKKSNKMKICSFLWSYFGYPTSTYEGRNVEEMRYKNGEIMVENDIKNNNLPDVDSVAGVPDSGTPHAIGFATKSKIAFQRPFIKYTPTWPRSFMPPNQKERNKIAKMKMIPVSELIKNKKLLFVDDSIVRGTQMKETVDFLYKNGAKEVHMRSACPPIMYGCKYLNFSRQTNDNDLITRQTILELEGEEGLKHIDEYILQNTERGKNLRNAICKKLKLSSLEFQTLDGLQRAIGLDKSKLCTYCWNKEE